LLEDLLEIPTLRRIRLSSILSRHLTEDLVELIAAEPRICRHLHVPLQAGDDGILEAMHRPYRIDEFCASLQIAQRRIEGLALATDVIVGFPGESEEAFEATMRVVRTIGFSKLHVFRFSARPGTPAAEMTDDVPMPTRKTRSSRLIALGNEIRASFLSSHLAHPLEVLVEDERQVDGVSVCSGQTSDYVRVWFYGSDMLGEIKKVRGLRVRADGIEGELFQGREIADQSHTVSMEEGSRG
jgi:threonylcarbamoyladenosine tRNA methylthiotransferase MtaB